MRVLAWDIAVWAGGQRTRNRGSGEALWMPDFVQRTSQQTHGNLAGERCSEALWIPKKKPAPTPCFPRSEGMDHLRNAGS